MLVATDQQVAQIRKEAEEGLSEPLRDDDEIFSDASVQRYYRATSGNVHNAAKRLVSVHASVILAACKRCTRSPGGDCEVEAKDQARCD